MLSMITVSTPRNNSNPDQTYKDKNALMRAAESLRHRVADAKEYAVISETETGTEQSQPNPIESWIWNTEYEEALKLKKTLISKYKSKTLEEAIPGEISSNEQGQCYSISEKCDCRFKKVNYEESRQRIISDLKILQESARCERKL